MDRHGVPITASGFNTYYKVLSAAYHLAFYTTTSIIIIIIIIIIITFDLAIRCFPARLPIKIPYASLVSQFELRDN
jgi:hypothetical protein